MAKPLLLSMVVLAMAYCGCTDCDVQAGRVPGAPADSLAQPKPFIPATQPAADDGDSASRIIEGFQAAYIRHGKPRILLLVNRKLSDPVPEWQDQLVVRETRTSSQQGQPRQTEKALTAVSIEKTPPKPATAWLWAFEDAMTNTLLRSKAEVVDPSGVDESGAVQPGNDDKTVAGDIIIEVLVMRRADAVGGYEFKATAKERKGGKVIGHITSLNWSSASRPRNLPVVNDNGYGVVTWDRLLPPSKTGSALMIDLMRVIMDAWAER